MAADPIIGFTLLESAQSGKEVTANAALTDLAQSAGGYLAKSVAAGGTISLSLDESQYGTIELTGAPGSTVTVVLHASVAKRTTFINSTTGGQTIQAKYSTGSTFVIPLNVEVTLLSTSAAVRRPILQTNGGLTLTAVGADDAVSRGYQLNFTFPSVTTAERYAARIDATTAGSSANGQVGFHTQLLAGYTGSGICRAGNFFNNVAAATGTAFGIFGISNGASLQNAGCMGNSLNGTHNVAVWGGLQNVTPVGFNHSAAGAFSNGTTTDRILSCFDNGVLVFDVKDGGALHNTPRSAAGLGTGDFWQDSDRKAFRIFMGGTVQTAVMAHGTTSSNAGPDNTTTETSLKGTVQGVDTIGTFGDQSVLGKTWRVTACGWMKTNAAADDLRIRLKIGSVTVLDSGAVAVVGGLTDVLWEFSALVTVRVAGASGEVIGQGCFRYNGTSAIQLVRTTNATGIDFTSSKVVDLTGQWDVAAADNEVIGTNWAMEAVN